MGQDLDLAGALLVSIGLVTRRVRQVQLGGKLALPETVALSRLDRGGRPTSSEQAKLDQISPQSMGATMASLEARDLVRRVPDAADGRRVVLSITAKGRALLRSRRNARAIQLATALSSGFSAGELAQLAAAAPLIERLALNL